LAQVTVTAATAKLAVSKKTIEAKKLFKFINIPPEDNKND
jgi:hypothetical protein